MPYGRGSVPASEATHDYGFPATTLGGPRKTFESKRATNFSKNLNLPRHQSFPFPIPVYFLRPIVNLKQAES